MTKRRDPNAGLKRNFEYLPCKSGRPICSEKPFGGGYCEHCKRLLAQAQASNPLPELPLHLADTRPRDHWIKSGTAEDMARLRAADGLYEAEIAIYIEAKIKLHHKAVLTMIGLYGLDNPAVKALRKNVPRRPYGVDRGKDIASDWERYQRQAKEQRAQDDAKTERVRKAERARVFLRARGQDDAAGDDALAISSATDIAEDEAIERITPKPGEFIQYNAGSSCDRPCRGWDGKAYRCECGNRRVYWDSQGDFENLHVYAQADGG